MRIETMSAADAAAVLAIYQAGIDEGNATFETQAPAWPEFDAARPPDHRFVALDDHGHTVGWVAVSAVSTRPDVTHKSPWKGPGAAQRGPWQLNSPGPARR